MQPVLQFNIQESRHELVMPDWTLQYCIQCNHGRGEYVYAPPCSVAVFNVPMGYYEMKPSTCTTPQWNQPQGIYEVTDGTWQLAYNIVTGKYRLLPYQPK